ncbi:MAG TPA: hypothetical protein PKH77_26210 [Anaerolineae bacterium]|nr:hypothetical protein [Anaerolineae bacterium]
MNTADPKSSALRFLLLGGWTAIKSAALGSVFAVLVALTISSIYGAWRNGWQTLEFNASELRSFFLSAGFLSLLAILFSVLPACIGGVFLAWLIRREHSRTPISRPGKLKLGTVIGASAGAILALLILVPVDYIDRTAHGGYGYNPAYSLPIYALWAIGITVIAAIAGAWTDRQLRKYLDRARSNNTG